MSKAAERIEAAKRAYHDAVQAVTDARVAHTKALELVERTRDELEAAIEAAKREQAPIAKAVSR